MIPQKIGETILRLNSVSSTSNYVANSIEKGEYEWGTAILADFQTHGRGQRDAVWQSEPGQNLTFSFGAEFIDFDPRAFFKVTQCISLALREFVASRVDEEVFIKWPNDIISNGKKLAGILVESKVSKNPYFICGIGLNINQLDFGQFSKAGSIRAMTGQVYDLEVELKELLKLINIEWIKLSSGDFRSLKSDYMKRLYGFNSMVDYREAGKTCTGRIVDLSEEGMLIIEKNGNRETHHPKAIQLEY